ncbi:unnamed protein product, partial [Allacma fusca]
MWVMDPKTACALCKTIRVGAIQCSHFLDAYKVPIYDGEIHNEVLWGENAADWDFSTAAPTPLRPWQMDQEEGRRSFAAANTSDPGALEVVDEEHRISQEEPTYSSTLTRKERRKLGVQRKRKSAAGKQKEKDRHEKQTRNRNFHR